MDSMVVVEVQHHRECEEGGGVVCEVAFVAQDKRQGSGLARSEPWFRGGMKTDGGPKRKIPDQESGAAGSQLCGVGSPAGAWRRPRFWSVRSPGIPSPPDDGHFQVVWLHCTFRTR